MRRRQNLDLRVYEPASRADPRAPGPASLWSNVTCACGLLSSGRECGRSFVDDAGPTRYLVPDLPGYVVVALTISSSTPGSEQNRNIIRTLR